jgi:hypothetical protein
MNVDVTLDRPRTLVWIDSREAVIVRWHDGDVRLERMESEVPAHHKATGHVRHDPTFRHGGGGPQTAGEPHRLEHLKRFIDQVANRLTPGDSLLILGPGVVHERLARHVAGSDAHRRRHREIACEASRPITDRQLVARLRMFAGVEARRHTVGAYRWSEDPAHRASGEARRPPRRVVEKPRHQLDPDLAD